MVWRPQPQIPRKLPPCGSEQAGLVARSVDGDGEAFARLVDLRLMPAFRLARAILGTAEEAEDAVQEAFISAWRALPTLHDPDRFDAWFSRIVVNACRMAMRRRPRVHGYPHRRRRGRSNGRQGVARRRCGCGGAPSCAGRPPYPGPHPALRHRIAVATHDAHRARDVRLWERLRALTCLAGVAAAAAALLAVAAAHRARQRRRHAASDPRCAVCGPGRGLQPGGRRDLNWRPRYGEEDEGDDEDDVDDEDDDEAVDYDDDADD